MSHAPNRLVPHALLATVVLALAGLTVALTTCGGAVVPPEPAAIHRTAVDSSTASDARTQLALRTQPAAVRGCWTAPVGSRFDYRLRDRLDVTIHSPEGGTQPGGALRQECSVTTTVLDRRADEVLVRHQISLLQLLGADNRLIENDPIQQSFEAASEQPVFVRLGANGRIAGYGFADGLDGDQRNFLRGTLGLLACEAPSDDAMQWMSSGDDTTGIFEVRYERRTSSDADKVVIARIRQRYTAMAGHDEVPEHKLRGAAEVHFDKGLGWLQQVRLDEGMKMKLPLLDLEAITERKAEAVLIDAGISLVDVDVAAAWRDATAPASGRDEQIGGYAEKKELERWQHLLNGVTVDQLLAELQQLLAADPVDNQALNDIFTKLQWLAKLDESAIEVLAYQLATNQMPEASARVALGALGAAGTQSSQQVLASVRADHNLGVQLRQAATLSCLQLAEPSTEIVAGLVAEATSDSELHGSSMLVLGALAPRSGALADGQSPQQALLAMEQQAAARGELDTWLLAIGNTGAPEVLPIATRLLGHTEAKVRAAACVALRSVAAEEALTALVQRGLTDSDPMVRYEAVLALGRRTEAAAREALSLVARNDPDQGVRARADRLLNPGS